MLRETSEPSDRAAFSLDPGSLGLANAQPEAFDYLRNPRAFSVSPHKYLTDHNGRLEASTSEMPTIAFSTQNAFEQAHYYYTMSLQLPSLASVLAPLHLLFYSTLLGTELYQSFVMTKICFNTLPKSAFTTLQKRVFPVYFKGQTALLLLTAATVPPYGPLSVTQSKVTWISFLVAGVTAVLNLAVYEPRTRKAMIDRIHQGRLHRFFSLSRVRVDLRVCLETRDSRLLDGEAANEPSLEMQKLNRVFSRNHAMCIHLNLISIGATLVYGAKLASQITI